MKKIDKNDNIEESLVIQTRKNILEYCAREKLAGNSILAKESELCERIGVSRSVIREALSQLRVLGFIDTRRKRGSVFLVPEIFGVLRIIVSANALDRQSLKDLYELRLMLEIGMSDFVFRGATKEKIDQLESLAEHEFTSTNDEEQKRIDVQFHSLLYEMTGNKNLADFHHILVELFNLYLPRMDNWQSKQPMSHLTLAKILRNGNPDMFRSAIRLHLTTQFENMEKILESTKNRIITTETDS